MKHTGLVQPMGSHLPRFRSIATVRSPGCPPNTTQAAGHVTPCIESQVHLHRLTCMQAAPSAPLTPQSSTCSGGRITTFPAPPTRSCSAAVSAASSRASSPRSLFDVISHPPHSRTSSACPRRIAATDSRQPRGRSLTPHNLTPTSPSSTHGRHPFTPEYSPSAILRAQHSMPSSSGTVADPGISRTDAPRAGRDSSIPLAPTSADDYGCHLSVHNCQVTLCAEPAPSSGEARLCRPRAQGAVTQTHRLLRDAGLDFSAVQQWIAGTPAGPASPGGGPPVEPSHPSDAAAPSPARSPLNVAMAHARIPCPAPPSEPHEASRGSSVPPSHTLVPSDGTLTTDAGRGSAEDDTLVSTGDSCHVHAHLHPSPFSVASGNCADDSALPSAGPFTHVDSGAPDISASQALESLPSAGFDETDDSDPFLHEGPREASIEAPESEPPPATPQPPCRSASIERAASYDPGLVRGPVFRTSRVADPPLRTQVDPLLPHACSDSLGLVVSHRRTSHLSRSSGLLPATDVLATDVLATDVSSPARHRQGTEACSAECAGGYASDLSGMDRASSASHTALACCDGDLTSPGRDESAMPLSTSRSSSSGRAQWACGDIEDSGLVLAWASALVHKRRGDTHWPSAADADAGQGGHGSWKAFRSVSDTCLLPGPSLASAQLVGDHDSMAAVGGAAQAAAHRCAAASVASTAYQRRTRKGPPLGTLRCAPSAPAGALADFLSRELASLAQVRGDCAGMPLTSTAGRHVAPGASTELRRHHVLAA